MELNAVYITANVISEFSIEEKGISFTVEKTVANKYTARYQVFCIKNAANNLHSLKIEKGNLVAIKGAEMYFKDNEMWLRISEIKQLEKLPALDFDLGEESATEKFI